ncbi:SLC13 family permease [Pseudonocardia nematodicida]|uniref:SLC13 family permease n=1 Tax=Pseudonocardia nematodicida TaxID=1206997 RepID=A0ABV1KEA1_9PSEU
MLTIVGLLTIATVVLLLVTGRVTPIAAFSLPALGAALFLGHGASDLAGFFESGIGQVVNIAVMFVFAILMFGTLADLGLFDPLVRVILRVTGGNIVAICVGTVILAVICQLDGAGPTTLLVTIAALLPTYRRLGMSPLLLLSLTTLSIGLMNLTPWGGPLARASAVTGIDVAELWRPLIPLQLIGVVLLIGIAVVLGMRERRRIGTRVPEPALVGGGPPSGTDDSAGDGADGERPDGTGADTEARDDDTPAVDPTAGRPDPSMLRGTHTFRMWFNLAVALGTMGLLVTGTLPPGYAFLLGASVVLVVNFRSRDDQMAQMRRHAPNGLTLAAIILAAGTFLGVMSETGMLESVALDLIAVLPQWLVENLHILFGFLSVPLDFVLSVDAYWFALFPVVLEVTGTTDISTTTILYSMLIGNTISSILGPLNPVIWLALSLVRAEFAAYVRYVFPWMWGFSLALFGAAILLGLVQI